MPVPRELEYIFVKIGAISWCNSFKSLGERSGPEALFGLRFFKSVSVPLMEISMSGISGHFWDSNPGTRVQVQIELSG